MSIIPVTLPIFNFKPITSQIRVDLNGLERRPSRFSTICAKNQVLKFNIDEFYDANAPFWRPPPPVRYDTKFSSRACTLPVICVHGRIHTSTCIILNLVAGFLPLSVSYNFRNSFTWLTVPPVASPGCGCCKISLQNISDFLLTLRL